MTTKKRRQTLAIPRPKKAEEAGETPRMNMPSLGKDDEDMSRPRNLVEYQKVR
jgi:hypothetical protein